jgi:hypothetical protein
VAFERGAADVDSPGDVDSLLCADG